MYNPIDENGWEFIGKMLNANKTLKWINLAGTKCGENGCKFIGNSIKNNKSIRVLNLCISL